MVSLSRRRAIAAALAALLVVVPSLDATAAKEPTRHQAHAPVRAERAVPFERKLRRQVPRWGRAQLRSIAACESHNDPRAVGGGGMYRGLYQFSFSTWRVVGGKGDPAAASRWEQTWRAWLLLSRHGAGHWPVCG